MDYKILITGAGGFVGKSLIRYLSKFNYDIFALDICPCPDSLKKISISWYQSSFISPDIESIVKEVSPDIVIHLATTLFPNESRKHPVEDCYENLFKSLCFFEECYKNGTSKVIYASSAGTVYGDNIDVLYENSSTYPKVSYGVTKLCVEHYLRIVADKYEKGSISLRISNPFGEEQSLTGNQGVIPIFLNKIFNNEKIEVWGDINSTRDYIYIDTLIDAFKASIDYQGRYREFNIGSGVSYSLKYIINTIENILDKKADISIVSNDFNKPNNVSLSIERAISELHIKKDIHFEEHVRVLAKYHGFIKN
ncbi:NAD-dependent epimerase/dehydratase family protein [Vibrio furnissii]|uniref:NAD-dependent epimerase/dehydratase family protein n=1 Tax=Vibrio TaxID=662 RepID=UPI0037486624